MLVAIFCSNFPESLVGAVAMRRGGRSAPFAIAIWLLTAVLLTGAVVFGRGVFAQLPEEHLAFPLAFAGGAVLASLADTLMPEAFEHGRPLRPPGAGLAPRGGSPALLATHESRAVLMTTKVSPPAISPSPAGHKPPRWTASGNNSKAKAEIRVPLAKASSTPLMRCGTRQ